MLTTEQRFAIAKYKLEVNTMAEPEVKAELVKMYEEFIRMDVKYQKLIANAWGIEDTSSNSQ